MLGAGSRTIHLLDGKSLHVLEESQIFYCVYPKIGGRAPDELFGPELEQVGRLLARILNVVLICNRSKGLSSTLKTTY